MSNQVDAAMIEEIVGRKRHERYHFARAVSEEQEVYVLHSRRCMEKHSDLRVCEFSHALDRGIDGQEWVDWADQPVLVNIRQGRLVPDPYVVPDHRERFRLTFGGIKTWHVLRESNFPVHTTDWLGYGMWTRKGVDTRALCGGLGHTMVGIDVADWREGVETINPDVVSCKRCRASYEKILSTRTKKEIT